MLWEVEFTPYFESWWSGLSADALYDAHLAELKKAGLL